MITEVAAAISQVLPILKDPQNVSRIVVSGRQRNQRTPFIRVDIRPVMLKSGLHWQEVSHDGKKDFTKNLGTDEINLEKYINLGFANLLVETNKEEVSIRITKSGQAQITHRQVQGNQSSSTELSHDRGKQRLLPESDQIFTVLGISDHNGKLKPSKTDKFKQVQEFLKNIEYVMQELNLNEIPTKTLKIVDLGCGHAYLTFAAYRYLHLKGFSVEVLGVDERKDSKNRNTAISLELGLAKQVKFEALKISDLNSTSVDIAIALHACDTATDDAIAWAVKNKASAILVAPCCQHDIQKQISKAPSPWNIATRHGILHERLGDIITETVRAQTLRILGFRTEIIEFIAGDHTPKNLMIRAIKTRESKISQGSIKSRSNDDKADLELLLEQWQIKPKLMDLLQVELKELR